MFFYRGFHHFDSIYFLLVRMEDVVNDGWDVSVAHTVSLQVILVLTVCFYFCSYRFYQMQCLRCKCRIAIVFPPEGVPSLDMLLDTGGIEQGETAGAVEESDDNDDAEGEGLGGGRAAEECDETDDAEQDREVDEAEECGDDDDSSSGGESDADNGMGRKTGAARVMVESFADRCVQRRRASLLVSNTCVSESRWAGWCPGCRRGLAVGVRRQLQHDMNATIAIADCRGCSVVDFLPSSFIISCSACSAPVVLPDRQQRARRYNVVRHAIHGQSGPLIGIDCLSILGLPSLSHAHCFCIWKHQGSIRNSLEVF